MSIKFDWNGKERIIYALSVITIFTATNNRCFLLFILVFMRYWLQTGSTTIDNNNTLFMKRWNSFNIHSHGKKLCNTIFCVSLGYFNLLYFFFGKNRATLNETLSKRIECYELIKLSLLLRYDPLSYLYNWKLRT